ncbi:hypothetical protein Tco_0405075 [Tanacetum coccineum]
MRKRGRSTRGQSSSSHEETMEEKVRKFGLFDNGNHQMNYNNLVGRFIHSRDVVDWEFLSNKGLAQPFFNFINTDTFSGPQWVNLFQINEPIFRELVRVFFASFKFDATPCRYEPLHKGVTFRLGGVEREMSLLELGWRVGLYSERESRDVATLSSLRGAKTVNSTRLTHLFWPSIGDGGFNVRNTKDKSIRNPKNQACSSLHYDDHLGWESSWNYTRVSVVSRLPKRLWRKVKVMMRNAMEKGGNEGVGGSADIYRNMSQGDWQVRQARWMDQQDEHWGRIDAWMGQQDERAH